MLHDILEVHDLDVTFDTTVIEHTSITVIARAVTGQIRRHVHSANEGGRLVVGHAVDI